MDNRVTQKKQKAYKNQQPKIAKKGLKKSANRAERKTRRSNAFDDYQQGTIAYAGTKGKVVREQEGLRVVPRNHAWSLYNEKRIMRRCEQAREVGTRGNGDIKLNQKISHPKSKVSHAFAVQRHYATFQTMILPKTQQNNIRFQRKYLIPHALGQIYCR